MTQPQHLIRAMIPSVGQYFRSFYYPATHLSPVDLDQNLKQHGCPQADVVEAAQRVVSSPKVQEVLSSPFSFELEEVGKRNKFLQEEKFQILAQKPILKESLEIMMPFYSVCECPNLPNWIIKAAGYRVPQDRVILGPMNDRNEIARFTFFDSLLRFTMNQRIRQAAKDLEIDLVVPDEYAVPYGNLEQGDVSRRYFVLSQKLDLKSEADTVAHISNMGDEEQIELACKISLLIKNIGFADASFDNIRFTTDGKLAFIDTEPVGLWVARGDPLYTQGHSIEKCARVGLCVFRDITAKKGLNLISQEVYRHYQNSLKEISITRIVLSIICPLIPLVFLVIAVVNKIRIGKLAKQIVDIDIDFDKFLKSQKMMHPETSQLLDKWHKSQTRALRERYFSAIDGVPFTTAAIAYTNPNK